MLNWFKKKLEKDRTENGNKDDLTAVMPQQPVTVEAKTDSNVVTTKINDANEVSVEQVTKDTNPSPQQPPPLTYKEARSLKKARYE